MEERARLRIAHAELAEANAFVEAHHRHHKPARGHRFSLAAVDQHGAWRGVVMVGRPVGRLAGDPREVVEVIRLATDGVPNGCSFLLGAAARASRALGYRRIQTYTLESEPGSSLRAANWQLEALVRGRAWVHTDGKARRQDQPTCRKQRWALLLD